MLKVISFGLLFYLGMAQDSKEGEICGGMMKPSHSCAKPLECVNTKGPLIADAPGTCRVKCNTKRDDWGNCIPSNCNVWNDGCNT